MNHDLTIVRLGPEHAGEILCLQRAAYVSEAQLYSDPFLPALTQTFDDLLLELQEVLAFGVWMDERLVGAVRVAERDRVAEVGRLVVAPDCQGRGVGTRLMNHVHENPPAEMELFELFTGHLSKANLRMYQMLGYEETERRPLSASVNLVYLRRPVR